MWLALLVFATVFSCIWRIRLSCDLVIARPDLCSIWFLFCSPLDTSPPNSSPSISSPANSSHPTCSLLSSTPTINYPVSWYQFYHPRMAVGSVAVYESELECISKVQANRRGSHYVQRCKKIIRCLKMFAIRTITNWYNMRLIIVS